MWVAPGRGMRCGFPEWNRFQNIWWICKKANWGETLVRLGGIESKAGFSPLGFGYAGGLNIAVVTAKSGTGWDIVAAPAGPGSKSEVKRFATSRLALVDALCVANPGFNLGISLG